ncbi:MAG: hypothetical protein ACTHN0_12745 [Aquihabitans sp.]
MGVVNGHEGDRQRIAALEAELATMRQEMAELRAQLAPPAVPKAPPAAPTPMPSAAGDPVDAVEVPRPVSRRGLIAGAAGAVAAGAAMVVGNASPAAANGQGEAWKLGAENTCTTTTTLYATNLDPVLMITSFGTSGANAAQFYVHDATGSGAVTHHETAGLGPAAEFINSNTANTQATVDVQTDGKGPAGKFVVSNSANSGNGLGVVHNGSGTGVSSVNSGSGSAAFFGGNAAKEAVFIAQTGTGNALLIGSTNTTTTNPTVQVQTTAKGPAIRAQAPVTNLSLVGRSASGAPTADTAAHAAGDLVEDSAGQLWVCVAGGTPGQWRKLAGPATAGALHILPTPVRVYDSRPGSTPNVGSKTPLAAGSTRTVDLTANGSGVPAGATAAMVNLLIVNAAAGSANFTLWKNGVAKPQSNTMVWGGSVGRFSTLALTALDASGKAAVSCSVQTDVVVDVVSYYR